MAGGRRERTRTTGSPASTRVPARAAPSTPRPRERQGCTACLGTLCREETAQEARRLRCPVTLMRAV